MLQVVGFSASFQVPIVAVDTLRLNMSAAALLIPISYPISVVDPNEPPVTVLSLELHTCPL